MSSFGSPQLLALFLPDAETFLLHGAPRVAGRADASVRVPVAADAGSGAFRRLELHAGIHKITDDIPPSIAGGEFPSVITLERRAVSLRCRSAGFFLIDAGFRCNTPFLPESGQAAMGIGAGGRNLSDEENGAEE